MLCLTSKRQVSNYHKNVYLGRNWLAGADAVVLADFLLLVPAVLPGLVPALLI